jgi:hypothetical protein
MNLVVCLKQMLDPEHREQIGRFVLDGTTSA